MIRQGFSSASRSAALGACALALAATPGAQKEARLSQKEISRELQRLHDDDQKDQNDPTWNESTDREFSLRQKERRDRVMEIVAAGTLADMHDWGNAALLLQHGQGADDFVLAHVLALPAASEGEPFTAFLSAATLDRFLHSVGRAQVFTTQSGAADPSVYAPVEPFDDSMSESLRARFDLKPLPGRGEQDKKRGKGVSAKELPKLLARAEPVAAGADPPEWLVRTRELVLAGAPSTEKELELAARILAASEAPEDLLSAHVLAMTAALRAKKPEARRSCAETLDRFLLAIGRPQRFDTVLDGAAPKEPRAPLAQFIREQYGLAAAPQK